MRFFNASHVDYSGLHERRPELGKFFLLVAAILLPLSLSGSDYIPIYVTFGMTFVVWLAAWYLIVGVFYRIPLSAALLLQLVMMSYDTCGCAL